MAFAMSPSDIEYQLAHIHDNRSDEIITAGAICISMAIGAVVLRLISRQLSRVGSVQLDGYVIISSLVSLMLPDGYVHCALNLRSC